MERAEVLSGLNISKVIIAVFTWTNSEFIRSPLHSESPLLNAEISIGLLILMLAFSVWLTGEEENACEIERR
jgi:hypothetical protein